MPATNLVTYIAKGIFLGLIYFETTKAKDTTLQNLILFTLLFTVMSVSSELLGVDPIVITNAFITKTIFTLVDERVKKDEGK